MAPRVLIIEDNDDIRAMLALTLQMEGFDVDSAANGEQAMRQLGANHADVIVTDLFMPDKDGIETIVELRKSHPGIPILAMSGWQTSTGPNYLDVAREIGAARTLKKPFEPDELVRVVRELLPKI